MLHKQALMRKDDDDDNKITHNTNDDRHNNNDNSENNINTTDLVKHFLGNSSPHPLPLLHPCTHTLTPLKQEHTP
jgi:hypothetical protein